MESLSVYRRFLLPDITFDGELRFQPSKGHFHLKFYAPSYCIIKMEKRWIPKKYFFKDGVQIFFFWNRRDRKKIFFQDGVKKFSKMESKKIFFFFDFNSFFELKTYLCLVTLLYALRYFLFSYNRRYSYLFEYRVHKFLSLYKEHSSI